MDVIGKKKPTIKMSQGKLRMKSNLNQTWYKKTVVFNFSWTLLSFKFIRADISKTNFLRILGELKT